MTTLDAAMAAAERGWAVFPCLPGEKRPAVANAWESRATTDPAVIERHWPRGANVGVACGPSSLVVVDCDVAKEGQSPDGEWAEPGVVDGVDALALLAERSGALLPLDGPLVRTPSGGMHLYFRAPGGAVVRNSASKVAWKVDVRARGGYVVGPGSVTPTGAYEFVHDSEAEALPEWVLCACNPPEPDPATVRRARPALPWGGGGGGREEQYRYAAMRNAVGRLLGTGEGGRNDALNAEAYGLVKAGWGPTEVESVLLDAAAQIGLPSAEASRTLASALRPGRAA